MSRIVISLGGNALGSSPVEQQKIVKNTAVAIVDIINEKHDLVICHGNGPQVGMINNAFNIAYKFNKNIPLLPFPECGAMSQAYIGYHLQNAILNELRRRNIKKNVVTIITQVEVDVNDDAFRNPSKPIGLFYSEKKAKNLAKSENFIVKEDSGRGWRRVIASPNPIDIIEKDVIIDLINNEHIVICAGGGGIPVVKNESGVFEGVSAVIDKDLASSKLADLINADKLIILTSVNKVSINFGQMNEQKLDKLTVLEAEKYINENQFSSGSMLPKIQAAINFIKSNTNDNRIVTIASLSDARNVVNNNDRFGTIIKM